MPFTDLQPIFRAKVQRDAAPFQPANVASLQIMFSKFEADGVTNPTFVPGAFELPMLSVRTYLLDERRPRVVCVRPLPDVDERLAAELQDESAALRAAGASYRRLLVSGSAAAPAEAQLEQVCTLGIHEPLALAGRP